MAVSTPRILIVLVMTGILLGSCGVEPEFRTELAVSAPEAAVTGRFLAATVPWNDERREVSAAEAIAPKSSGNLEILDLDDVRLPRKMVAVDGLYPGDAGYPLIEWTLAIDPRSGEPHRRAVERAREAAAVESPGNSGFPAPTAPIFYHIAGVGDIMPGRGFDTLLAGPHGITEALGDVAPLLSAPDLLIGNLETAVTDHPQAVPKSYNFKVPFESLEILTSLGFDFYHLANNHGWDYGEKGFIDTLQAVERVGAGYSGAGLDLEESRFIWETPLPGDSQGPKRIRILSLGAYFTERNGFDGASQAASGPMKPGVLWDSPENETYIRESLTSENSFIIVTVHGGHEWHDEPGDDVQALYRRYVEWGADLVLAHHPHVLQGAELYKGGIIAYSLGNFIFPGMKGWYTGEETGILDLRILNGKIVGIDFLPISIDDVRLRRAEGSGIDSRFWEMSRTLETEE